MRVLIISDAWHPQINGVVRTLEATAAQLRRMGHQVEIIGPAVASWRTIAAPSYPSIRLEFFARPRLRRVVETFRPDFIHIATEGPLGWAARSLCLQLQKPFTTSYHTRFPEYLAARAFPMLRKIIGALTYAVLRRFHAPSSAVMVATDSIESELQRRKFRRLTRWSRGVDTDVFRPYGKDIAAYAALPRPILLYVGRVATEKNLEAFLAAEVVGSKVVIGDGPDRQMLSSAYPAARFLGAMEGETLARHYAAADVFVFPSATDTFGLVLLEAAAAGLRIASYPAPGPVDIFASAEARAFSVLNVDLSAAIRQALALSDDPTLPRRFAEGFSWEVCTQQFYQHLQAPTPQAIKRLTRLRNWLARSWQRAFYALKYKRGPRE
jgi:glycosyltransferase involved in cell wall biosynthesis